MAEDQNNIIAKLIQDNRLLGQQEAIDTITLRHSQVLAVLASLSLGFTSSESHLGAETVRNTLDAARELLEQAQDLITAL